MSSTLAVHLFIPGRHIGAVEDSTNRQNIERASRTEIKILDKNAQEERLVAVSGQLHNVRSAVNLILNLYSEDVSVKLPVAKNQIGALIGKQGSTIQTIRDLTGCVVQAYSEEESVIYQPDRVMFLQGNPKKVGVGILRCFDILMQAPANKKAASPPTSPPFRTMDSSNPMSPSILSPGRGAKRPSPAASGRSTPPPPFSPLIMTPPSPSPVGKQDVKRPRIGGSDSVEIPGQATVKMEVTGAQAGIVIGQKGSTIKQIRTLSGARVNIDSPDEAQAKNPDGSKRDCREMIFVGTVSQCEAALNLLKQCFQDNAMANGNSGGSTNKNNRRSSTASTRPSTARFFPSTASLPGPSEPPELNQLDFGRYSAGSPYEIAQQHARASPHHVSPHTVPHHRTPVHRMPTSPHSHPSTPPSPPLPQKPVTTPVPLAHEPQKHDFHFEARDSQTDSTSASSRPFSTSPRPFSPSPVGSYPVSGHGADSSSSPPRISTPGAWRSY